MSTSAVKVTLSPFEQRLVVEGMAELRNRLIWDGKPTEDVDDVLLKLIDARKVKRKKADREAR